MLQASLVPVAVAWLLGLCLGSFAGVLWRRIPLREAWWAGRSRCVHCRRRLGAADLVPLLSFVWLRGRCRYCRAPIALFYPAVELAGGGLAAAGFVLGGGSGLVLALALIVAGGCLAGRRPGAQAGLSTVEVLCALLLVSLALAGCANLLATAAETARTARVQTLATALLSEELERLRSSDFAAITPQPEEMVPAFSEFRRGVSVEPVAGGNLEDELKRVVVTVRYRPVWLPPPADPEAGTYRAAALIARRRP